MNRRVLFEMNPDLIMVNFLCEFEQIMPSTTSKTQISYFEQCSKHSNFDPITLLVNLLCELEKITRRLCVLSNTKLYQRNLLL